MSGKHSFKAALKRINVREWFRYDNLVRNIPMLLLLTFLAVFYIWNRHSAHRHVVELNRIQNELQEANWEFASVKKDLNNRSMQTEVSRQVEPLGLQELTTPPYKILLSDDDKK
jgi:cell division protein FtsL